MQLDLFAPPPEQDLVEALFQAYFDCRRNKRNTLQALAFEQHFEANLFALHDELVQGTYQLGPSIAFIVDKPVQREIFAAAFRDRVVHHLLINKLEPFFEQLFLPDSYACRKGRGTHYGIRRVAGWVDACAGQPFATHHILKLDVRGFFMHIDRQRLFDRLQAFILERYPFNDREFVLQLARTIVFNDPTQNCVIQGSRRDWEGLPPDKSLFRTPRHCGLPIGNLTSQVLANFYMHPFDVFVKRELGVEYYGRYVDDFVLVHESKEHLLGLLPRMRRFLHDELGLQLHPHKIYLQHVSKGVRFLGCSIKPGRVLMGRRTKGNFHAAVQAHNAVLEAGVPDAVQLNAFLCTMNSYLGMLKHVRSHRLRKKMLYKRLHPGWWRHMRVNGALLKVERIKVARRNGA
jgi:retron-type reverse transcriptase